MGFRSARAAPLVGSRADVAPVAAIRLEEEWSYRRFLDSEPSSTDKHYVASGYFVANLRADIYPFSEQAGALHDFGFVGSYGRAFGLKWLEIDTIPPSEVDTTFYHFDAGVAYRVPSSRPLSLTVAAAYERWVFDFRRGVAASRGADRALLAREGRLRARFAVGPLALLGNAALLLPLSIGSLGDRDPTGMGFGARAKLGVAVDLCRCWRSISAARTPRSRFIFRRSLGDPTPKEPYRSSISVPASVSP